MLERSTLIPLVNSTIQEPAMVKIYFFNWIQISHVSTLNDHSFHSYSAKQLIFLKVKVCYFETW